MPSPAIATTSFGLKALDLVRLLVGANVGDQREHVQAAVLHRLDGAN
jgi:hypothetical protein